MPNRTVFLEVTVTYQVSAVGGSDTQLSRVTGSCLGSVPLPAGGLAGKRLW